MSMITSPTVFPKSGYFGKNSFLFIQLLFTEYQLVAQSNYFPEIDIQDVVTRCLQITYERNTSAAIRDLKQRLGDSSQQL